MSERRKLHEKIFRDWWSSLYQGRCDTTQTERWDFPCDCGSYAGNLGPCIQYEGSGFCPYCAHAERCHQPIPDYDTDESANARLLEAMPLPRLYQYRSGDGLMWECAVNFNDYPMRSSDRKIAIVDAYAKWKGLA